MNAKIPKKKFSNEEEPFVRDVIQNAIDNKENLQQIEIGRFLGVAKWLFELSKVFPSGVIDPIINSMSIEMKDSDIRKTIETYIKEKELKLTESKQSLLQKSPASLPRSSTINILYRLHLIDSWREKFKSESPKVIKKIKKKETKLRLEKMESLENRMISLERKIDFLTNVFTKFLEKNGYESDSSLHEEEEEEAEEEGEEVEEEEEDSQHDRLINEDNTIVKIKQEEEEEVVPHDQKDKDDKLKMEDL